MHERDAITAALHERFARGRLDQEELDERVTATLVAKTAAIAGPPVGLFLVAVIALVVFGHAWFLLPAWAFVTLAAFRNARRWRPVRAAETTPDR